jgi:signal transduction histidine kinase/DNA-binding response OmpR family regulator
VAVLKDNINQMIGNLAETTRKNNDQDWLKTNIAKFTGMVQGQRDLLTVAQLLLAELTPLVTAQHGTFYMAENAEEMPVLKLTAAYAWSGKNAIPRQFQFGEGLVGECARRKERILLNNVPRDYVKISSSLGDGTPVNLIVLPVLFEGEIKAVVELASMYQFSDIHLAFLDQMTKNVGIVLNTIAATMRTDELLKQSQALAEQLQQTNEELQEKARLLADQKTEVEQKNQEVEQAKQALEEKAEQLALTSKYKSEFLANMSHELRTPLNNLLILARMLSENADRNLSSKQVKYAETIHSSGTDLLALINDILDLAKIESGKMDVELGSLTFTALEEYVSRTFRHVADGKGLQFDIEIDASVGPTMHTDVKRLQQVLKNLISNALKFTSKGVVKLRVEKAASGWSPRHPVLNRAKTVLAFSVSDTGIGIPPDKQQIIFEAFQQADGTTSRRYGGTGLGLSISRELTRLLGGEIRLQSQPGHGSTFTLYLPQTYSTPAFAPVPSEPEAHDMEIAAPEPVANLDVILPTPRTSVPAVIETVTMEDDRNNIHPGDPVLLIVEDDVTFARILLDLAHERNIKALVALRGSTALALAREFHPGAITLDIVLPDVAGWTILDRLKHDPETRHIPVHVISGDENRRRGLALGAMTWLEKTLSQDSLKDAFAAIQHSIVPRRRKLLLVSGSDANTVRATELLKGDDIAIRAAQSGAEAQQILAEERVDCVIIDVQVPEESAMKILEDIQRHASSPVPPCILYGTRPLTEEEHIELRWAARSGGARYAPNPERLLDESTLLSHRNEQLLSDEQKEILRKLRQTDAVLAGKKVLVVDDDLRNIFALTSVLEHHDLQVIHAENGRAGIELLDKTPGVDVVLMDIMMPEMDGYQTMRAIRGIPRFRTLPIIALTAKAMKGDRDKCIEAGASDYVTKPVDLEHLFSVMRVWVANPDDAQEAGAGERI